MILFDHKIGSRLPPFTPGCICVKSYNKNKNKTWLCRVARWEILKYPTTSLKMIMCSQCILTWLRASETMMHCHRTRVLFS